MDKPNMTKEDLDIYLKALDKKDTEFRNNPSDKAKIQEMAWEAIVRFHNQENI